MKRLLGLALVVCAQIFAQSAAPLLTPKQQFFDNNGYPLAGGLIYTCVAGSSCPGTPLATYTDSTAGTPNANPVVLDAAGRAAIWGGANAYKIVVQDSGGNTLATQDNVPAGALQSVASVLTSLAGATGATLVNYVAAVTGGVTRTVASKLGEQVSAKDFGAKGDNTTDDTAAVQACITWSQNNRGSCYLPPAVYKITGSGLSITGQAVVRSDSPFANGLAQLRYYGTGSALTVGTDAALVYGATLQNLMIVAADGVTASYGINIQGLTEAHWYGIVIGGGATTGKFTAGVRFFDSSGIAVDGLIVTNQDGVLGSTAVLFAEGGAFFAGNSNISIEHADMYMQSTMFDVHSCDDCRVANALNLESFDYLVNMDNTNDTLTNFNTFRVQRSSITANGSAYFSNRKVLNVKMATGKRPNGYLLEFDGNRALLAGGITNPMVVTVAAGYLSLGQLNVRVTNNVFLGANGALVSVSAASTLAHLTFGWNHVFSNDAVTRTPDVVPFSATTAAYYVNDELPINTSNQYLTWKDTNGTQYLAGSSSNTMTRPAAGALVPGAIYGVDQATPLNTNGFVRVGTGTASSASAAYCDWSGASSITDMNRNIVCFIAGTEALRIDGTAVTVSNFPFKATTSVTSTGLVTASGFVSGTSTGLTVVKNLTGSGGAACTETFTGGILTASTCP